MLQIESKSGEIVFSVRVKPRASRDAIEGVRDGALLVRLTAPPVDGEANEALVALLAARLHVPKSAVRIVGGERAKRKRIGVRGVAPDGVQALAAEGRT